MWEKAKQLRKSLRWKKKDKPILQEDDSNEATFAAKHPSKIKLEKTRAKEKLRLYPVNPEIELNIDTYTTIADFLDLESLLNFSVASKVTKIAARRVPLSVVLLRDVNKGFNFTNALPPTIIRLLVGKGVSYSTKPVVSYYSNSEKEVMIAKLSALKGLLELMFAQFEGDRFMNTVKNMFMTAIDAKNIVGIKAILSKLSELDLVFDQEFLEECIAVATEKAHGEVITVLVRTIGFGRVNLNLLIQCCKSARERNRVRVFATLLALICRCEPNLAAVNEVISSCLYSTAKDGQTELCIQLAKMFQLRVRFKKLRAAKDRAAQGQRAKNNTYSTINEELEDERLREEEGDISEAMKVFKRSLQTVLQTACRNNHTNLAKELLESKLASDVDENILFNFFKTAVGKGDEQTTKWLIKSRLISLERICEYFVNCARRNHQNSVRILLSTRVLPNPTLDYGSKLALRAGHSDLSHEILDFLV